MKTPMLMKPKLKIYAALLVATIALMVALGRCSRQYASKEAQSSGGDTIDVAIEYSPLSLYMYADTLGGFSHDLLNLIAKREHLHNISLPTLWLSTSRCLCNGAEKTALWL